MKKFLFHLIHGKEARYGRWMISTSGRQIWPMDCRPGDFIIEDVAHNLSQICRFAGSVEVFYPVSSHALMVADIVRDMGGNYLQQFQGLHHDDPEFCASDVPNPLKQHLPDYQKAERGIWKALAAQIGVPEKMSHLVKIADKVAMVTERRDLLKPSHHVWKSCVGIKPLSSHVKIMSSQASKHKFMERHHHLMANMASQPEDVRKFEWDYIMAE